MSAHTLIQRLGKMLVMLLIVSPSRMTAIRAAGMEAVDVRTMRCHTKLSPAALSRV